MSHYYFNAMLGSKILTYCTILNKIEQNKIKMTALFQVDKKWLKNSVRKQFLPKVAETLVETVSAKTV